MAQFGILLWWMFGFEFIKYSSWGTGFWDVGFERLVDVKKGTCALDSNFKAALTRPSIISLEKPLAICSV